MDPAPTIAIVGRPNVGKSTLFNRLIGKRHAITLKEAGTTRDRISQKWQCKEYETLLVDTGGLESEKKQDIESDIQQQAKLAIEDADITLFVIDISQELTVDDFAAADILRKSNKPVILVANKFDNKGLEENVFNIFELGFGEPIKISAIHKIGIDELENKIVKNLKTLKIKKQNKKTDETCTEIAILGKPNAGKSSLVNAFFGTEKVIVSDTPGTTRDTIDTEIIYSNQKYNIIDTAGLRRPGKRKNAIEKFSSLRCISSIERSDIVILLIDGEKGITKLDCNIANHALEAKKGLIIAINKIDLFEDNKIKNKYIRILRKKFSFVPWAPVVFVSAKNKKNIFELLTLAEQIKNERKKRIPTPELNNFLQKITYKHLPASRKIKKPRFLYGNQADTDPPTFVLFFKNPENLHFSYPRYLENEIRKEYGFNGTAITLKFKNSVKNSSQS